MPERRLRIAIVNDSPLAVATLRRAVESVPGYQVAWIAGEGAEAAARCADDLPDLVLMDLYMPGVDGVEATRRIMQASPCPVLVVTSRVDGAVDKVYDAMGHGALDAVDTPTLGQGGGLDGAAPLLGKIATIARLPRARALAAGEPAAADSTGGERPVLVAIGASTGGPKALVELLRGLGSDLPAAVLIVQHVDQYFAPGLATWLSEHGGFPVEPAAAGARPVAGRGLLAATGDHMVISAAGTVAYTPRPTGYPYRPSVDVCFRSLVAHWPRASVAALLTGMGRDGADGLLQLRRAGWWTCAEHERSCVVYGMPRAAIEIGAAREVLPVGEMGAAIRQQAIAAARRKSPPSSSPP